MSLSETRLPVALALLLGLALATPASAAELTMELVDSRLRALEGAGASQDDEVLKAYQAVRDRLDTARFLEQDAAGYVAALTLAPQREAEIQAKMDALEETENETEWAERFPLEQLEAQLTLARTQLRAATSSLDAIEKSLAGRETAANEIRKRLQEITKRLAEIGSLEGTIDPRGAPSLAEALEWSSLSERLALTAEQRAQEARLTSQPVRFSALRAEGSALALQIEKLTAKRHALEAAVRGAASQDTAPEKITIPADDPAYAIATELEEEMAGFRERRLALEESLAELEADLERIEAATRRLGERFATARRMVEFASGSDVLGNLLLAYWEEIETFRLRDPTMRIPQQVGDTVISRIDHEKALAGLASASSHVSQRLAAAGLDPTAVPAASRRALVERVVSQRELLRRIIAIESDQLSALSKLEASYARLRKDVDDYASYLGRLVLWLPSEPVLWKSDPREIRADYGRLMVALAEIRLGLQPSTIPAFLLVAILLYTRRRLREIEHAQSRHLTSARNDSILYTGAALLLAVLRALPLPVLAYAFGLLFAEGSSAIGALLPHTLRALFMVFLALTLSRVLCEESGVGRSHFGWSVSACERVREEAAWLIRWWLPVATLTSILFRLGDLTASLGRLGLLASLLLLAGHLAWQLRRERRDQPQRWFSTLPNRVRLALVAILALLVAGVVWGLHFSVGGVARNLLLTAVAGFALVILHSLLTRWLRVVRRRLRVEELLAARAARHAEQAAPEDGLVEEEHASLVELGAETTELLNAATATAGIALLLAIWMPLLPAFDALSSVRLWSSSEVVAGENVATQITLLTLLTVAVLLGVTFYAARKLPALVELILRSRTEMTPAARYTTITLLTYVIVGTGLLSALSSLGLEWAKLQWLVAALGVGIGFGLQEIIANFISGLIILFERPIRVGDAVTVGDQEGVVSKIRIRATTIRDWDGKELLVPNKEFITGRLLNWTLSDPQIRIVVQVGIAYGSDVGHALEILQEIARDNPDVLDEPKPSIIFAGFGDNTLDLRARLFIGAMDQRVAIQSAVYREIYKRLAEAGIVIAFPQRDLHFDADKPIRIAIDTPATD